MKAMLFQVVAAILLTLGTEAASDADEVTSLPGMAWKPNFKHYSGYLKATGPRMLHYWFLESQNKPQSDPVVLWLNGGPGCSSLDGLLSEHGAFLVAEDGVTLKKNPYSWNNVANILYLEAPAGVGYSYATDKNYTTGDDQVSLDNYEALKSFFVKFPEYKSNKFFITGESYGGVYVPTLSVRVAADSNFNFRGFAVGNGLSDVSMNGNSLVYFAYYHGLFGENLWDMLLKMCCEGQSVGQCDFTKSTNASCERAIQKMQEFTQNINIYNIYDECHTAGNLAAKEDTTIINPVQFLFPENRPFFGKKSYLKSGLGAKLTEVPPCINVSAVTHYVNDAAVRKAIHIPDFLPPWEICSGAVGLTYRREYTTLKKQYLDLLATRKYRILVYNGDVDMACNFLGDQWFVDSLKQKVVNDWSPWYFKSLQDQSMQIAGFVKEFYNIKFVTIKGAGHMVPTDKPVPALEMFTSFLQDSSL